MNSLRGLAALDPKPIKIANRYVPIAEPTTAIEVPLHELLIDAKPRRKRNKTKNIEKTRFMPHDDCGCCPSQMQKVVHKATKEKPIITPDIVHATPEMSTAWTKHRAVYNYEKFMTEAHGPDIKHDISIETIANTSLGIQGWALSDFGNSEESYVERTTYTLYSHDPSAGDHAQDNADETNPD